MEVVILIPDGRRLGLEEDRVMNEPGLKRFSFASLVKKNNGIFLS